MRLRLPKHEKNGEPLLVLFDGMALAYRAYFAFISRPLTNSRGENTSAVYGFTTALLQFLEHHSPSHAVVCFDTPHPTFRHERFKEYKAHRQAMPEDMIPQLGKIKEIVRAYNIPLVELQGYEADDVIGTLAKRAEQNGIHSLVVTPDKDFCQLVTPKIKLLRPAKEGRDMEIFDEQSVRDKYGLEPKQIIDYLALVGDASDNIPGVRGVGEKTAAPLISKFGSLNGIYEHIEEVDKKALKEKLVNDRENAFLSYELATIETNVNLPFTIEDLKYGNRPDYETLDKLFTDLSFNALKAKVHRDMASETANLQEPPKEADARELPIASEDTSNGAPPQPVHLQVEDDLSFNFVLSAEEGNITNTPHAYVLVRTMEALEQLVKDLQKAKEISFDLETTGVDANNTEIIGISFCAKPGEAYYIAVKLPDVGDEEATTLFEQSTNTVASSENAFTTGLDIEKVIPVIKPLLESPKIKKFGQNVKFDALVLRHYGIIVSPITFDTMIGAYILRSDGSHSMDSLSVEHLNYRPVPLTDVTGPIKSSAVRKTMGLAPTVRLAEYGAEDADVTFKLKQVIETKLKEESLLKLCEEIDFPLVEVLLKMEFCGVKIDTEMLAAASKEMEREATNLCNKIYEYAGGPFNIDSPKQLQDVLFKKLALTATKKTKTGYSTDVYVLEDLRNEHPIAECIINYRQYQKLRGTYIDALPQLVNRKTGMVHTSYNQAVVATGRISSTDPNLQNIPIRTEMGREIRKAFVSRFEGGQILSADYSQIELRIMAHVTKDASLMKSFKNNEDIHTATAAGVYGVPLDKVDRDMRRKAKEVNYGIMYGIGAFGLARRLGISSKEGSEIINRYFTAFPTIKKYMDDTLMFAREKGYVETLFGRRRYMRNINASNQSVRGGDERAAINMPIQGTAADMMKIAMLNIHREFERRSLRSLMTMQVHDELVFDVYPGEDETVKSIVIPLMENAVPMDVPISVEFGIGKNWFDAH